MELKTHQLLCFSYACSSQTDELKKRVKYSNKILLPPSILYELNDKNNNFDQILFFKIINKVNKLEEVCGVHEFTSPPGVVHLPYHIMEQLGIQEGDTIDIELTIPQNGTYIKLRPHTTEFIKLYNPKVILEKVLSKDYPVIKQGSTISIYYKELNKVYFIDILETKPEQVIKIINVNVNVDFEEPLDYVSPEKPVKLNNFLKKKKDEQKQKPEYNVNKFPGTGNRLGSE
jgi:ubiquitin fusion degradation protein 1